MRDRWLSLGIVLLALGIGLQMPKDGVTALKSLWLTLPLMGFGGWFLTIRLTLLTRIAVVVAVCLALVAFTFRQLGRADVLSVFLVAIPLTVFAVLGLCKNRRMPGSYAMLASFIMVALLVGLGGQTWPDLLLVVYVAALLALRSAPLPRTRFV